jgi:hypothetical protein
MDPESPSSRRPTDIEEEDSLLHQSAYPPPHPGMADSYPEDIASKAEEDTGDKTAEEMAEEEEEHDDRTEADEPEQLLIKLHGYWEKCQVKDDHVMALEKEVIMAPRVESQWRTHNKALVLAPNKTEVLMLKSHVERGFSMPTSHFFSNLLQFYGLQLHHIAPNSLVFVAGYAALCERYLRILPRVDLF